MKKIAVIHDLSGLGKCSLTAAIPVISAMGVQACPLPTAILSNQTGYGSYFTGFKFERVNNWGGFINRKVFFVHFTKDFELIKLDFE